MLQLKDLQKLSIEQLRAIEDSLDSYIFKQPDFGEPYHSAYRKNPQTFDTLIKHTVKLERIVRKYFQKQKSKLPQLVHLHQFVAGSEVKGSWITKNGVHIEINDVTDEEIKSASWSNTMGFKNTGVKEINKDVQLKNLIERNTTQMEYRDYKSSTKDRDVTTHIKVLVKDITDPKSEVQIVDGWHRIRQALDNKDKTIPAKLLFAPPAQKTHTASETITADEDDKYINSDAWDGEDTDFANDINDGLMPIYTTGAQATAEEIGVGTEVHASSAPSQKFLADYSLQLAKDINDTTQNDIKEAIQTSLKLGEARDELQNRLNDILDNDYRSQMIAQTESIRAYTQGRLDVGREIGYDQKQWNTQAGACPLCDDLDEQIVGIDEEFDAGDYSVDGPPLHPNCRCYINLLQSSDNDIEGSEIVINSIKGNFVTMSKGGNTWVVDLPDDGSGARTYTNVSRAPAKPPETKGRLKSDFSSPANGVTGDWHTDAEHMIKYNAQLQVSQKFPQELRDEIMRADVSKATNATQMGQMIVNQINSPWRYHPDVTTAITRWAKQYQMLQDWKTHHTK